MNNLMQLEELFITILFWSVLASSVLFMVENIGKQVWARWVGAAGMGVGLICATVSMVLRYVYAGYAPLSNLFESLVFLIFGMLAIYLVVHFTLKPKVFGVVAAPLTMLLIGFASVLPARIKDAHPLMPALQSYWLKIHVSLMLISYAAFLLAFAAAVIYLFLYYGKGKKENHGGGASGGGMLVLEGGPTVEGKLSAQMLFLDDLTYRLTLVGFPVLAIGIITGGMWANHAWGTYWSWDPKETWALITWLVYAGYLHARLTRDWRDHRAAWMSVVGFVSVLVTYLGVNYLAQGLHTYGSLL
ncbi:MAG TPA: c-type cytochrome biogenesis protein CcsB [Pantanalinema sp.]